MAIFSSCLTKHLLSVLGVTDQQFRSPVPPSGYVVRARLSSAWHQPREAEITKLDNSSGADEDVLWFDVSVYHLQ